VAWSYWRCGGALATWIDGSAETPGNLQRADIYSLANLQSYCAT
jgi:hypothetical protein